MRYVLLFAVLAACGNPPPKDPPPVQVDPESVPTNIRTPSGYTIGISTSNGLPVLTPDDPDDSPLGIGFDGKLYIVPEPGVAIPLDMD